MMNHVLTGISITMALLIHHAQAEPGGTYTLTGNEKGVTEIIRADMEKYPELYEGETLEGYARKFKKENRIGKRKLSPGDQLTFPETAASLSAKKRVETNAAEAQEEDRIPEKFKLRDIPSVVQEGSYCAPACGEVIAAFHEVDTDQYELAKLASQGSMDNSGTNPADLARALQNFGFSHTYLPMNHNPDDVDDFIKKSLPRFKEALVRQGPMYISIMEVFEQPHGCVVIGYDDKSEKMYFYNPWGSRFNLSYKEVAKYCRNPIAFAPPVLRGDETFDSTALVEQLKKISPTNDRNIMELRDLLGRAKVSFKYVECNRNDIMSDASETESLAKSEGQKLIEVALERAPAILVPQTDNEGRTEYVFVRKSPDSKRKLIVQRINESGWMEPELLYPSKLVRYWATPVEVNGTIQWRLPLFEFTG